MQNVECSVFRQDEEDWVIEAAVYYSVCSIIIIRM